MKTAISIYKMQRRCFVLVFLLFFSLYCFAGLCDNYSGGVRFTYNNGSCMAHGCDGNLQPVWLGSAPINKCVESGSYCIVGQKQYQPSGNCDTEERFCCPNGKWTEWGSARCPGCSDVDYAAENMCECRPDCRCREYRSRYKQQCCQYALSSDSSCWRSCGAGDGVLKWVTKESQSFYGGCNVNGGGSWYSTMEIRYGSYGYNLPPLNNSIGISSYGLECNAPRFSEYQYSVCGREGDKCLFRCTVMPPPVGQPSSSIGRRYDYKECMKDSSSMPQYCANNWNNPSYMEPVNIKDSNGRYATVMSWINSGTYQE